MCTKDFQSFVSSRFNAYMKTFSQLSKSNENDLDPLVNSENVAYDFDGISKSFAKNCNYDWASTDALIANGKKAIFIEFKKGFKDNLTTQKILDANPYTCPVGQNHCNVVEKERVDYCELFLKNRDLAKKNLLYNLQLKLLETLKILECCFYPLMQKSSRPTHLKIVYVVDSKYLGSPDETFKDMLASNANPTPTNKVSEKEIKTHLMKYLKEKLHHKLGVYFNELEVLEPLEFIQQYVLKMQNFH